MTGAYDFDCVAPGSCGIHCSRSGWIVLSFVATVLQLGFLLHKGIVMTALKLSAKVNTCDCAIKAASSIDRSGKGSCKLAVASAMNSQVFALYSWSRRRSTLRRHSNLSLRR
jgi:hypothetical protein